MQNDEWIKYVLGGYGVAVLTLAGGGFAIVQRVRTLEIRLGVLVTMLGEKAAKFIHSPHTPDLDRLLERFMGGEMKDNDWSELTKLLDEIEHDPSREKEEKAVANFLSEFIKKNRGKK